MTALGASTLASMSGCLEGLLGPSDPEQSTVELDTKGTFLVPETLKTNQNFGGCIDISDDTIFVGGLDSLNREPFPVDVFSRSDGQWSHSESIEPPNRARRYRFGTRLALAGDEALIAEEAHSTSDRPAELTIRVYHRSSDGWSEESVLWRSGPMESIRLCSIGLSRDTAIIGNPQTMQVHLFHRTETGWTEAPDRTFADSLAHDYGQTVALSPNNAYVGERDASINGDLSGTVHSYSSVNGTWDDHSTITPDSVDEQDGFGISVATSDSNLLVGASGDDDPNGSGGGSAHLYSLNEGESSKIKKVWSADGNRGNRFGASVDLADSTMIVGSRRATNKDGTPVGAAYLRRQADEWTHQYKLVDSDAKENSQVGYDVATDGSYAVVSAANHRGYIGNSGPDDAVEDPGGVFVLNLDIL